MNAIEEEKNLQVYEPSEPVGYINQLHHPRKESHKNKVINPNKSARLHDNRDSSVLCEAYAFPEGS